MTLLSHTAWLAMLCVVLMMGCQSETAQVAAPTSVPPTSEPAPTSEPEPELEPTEIVVSTVTEQIPAAPPATPTALPTAPVPTSLPTDVPTEVATETPVVDVAAVETTPDVAEEIEATATDEDEDEDETGCPSLDEVAGTRSPWKLSVTSWPKPTAFEGELFAAASQMKLIHLGFDVEGDPSQLESILDVLDRRGVTTTMFILGRWAETYPNLIKEMAQRGHEFANHTYSHNNMGEMTAEQMEQELAQTEAIVQRLTGQTTKPWMRPPFGSRSDISLATSYAGGWTTVIWSGSGDDWRAEYDEDAICKSLLDTSYAGGILYAHTSRPEMADAIDRYIGTMQARGFTFVPLSILMSGNPSLYLQEN
ncbi:MAG: polysaccharide deacetylase family protein [Candidatus Promineifilaceae bacterium]